MPMLVYSVAVALGIEQWSKHTGSILAVVVGGVLLASYGKDQHHNLRQQLQPHTQHRKHAPAQHTCSCVTWLEVL
jgi:hypothetical protein